MGPPALPPLTLEGWYALHQTFALDRRRVSAVPGHALAAARDVAASALEALASPQSGGWSAVVPLVGSDADLLLIHLRPTFDDIRTARNDVEDLELFDYFRLESSFLSVTEVGLYHLTADGAVPPEDGEVVRAERESAHTRRRLYPPLPPGMPWVCFYPMSKRREPSQNWYALPLAERSALMRAHGATGRRHATHIRQIITGAIGFDNWEWGVTIFAADPLAIKRVVTEMRFDEASASYAEFGAFHVGCVAEPRSWALAAGT